MTTSEATIALREASAEASHARQAVLSRGVVARVTIAAIFTAYASARFGDETLTYVLAACSTVIVVCGLHVLVHWSGQVSLGQVAFIGVGGFAAANISAELEAPLWLAAVGAVAAGCAASLLIGIPALRIRGFPLAITTLAAAYAADRWLFRQEWVAGQGIGVGFTDDRFLGFDTADPGSYLVPVAAITVLVVGVTARLGSSAVGRSMRMVAADDEVAASYGIHVGGHKLLAFLFAGGTAALAGAFAAMSLGRSTVEMYPVQQSIIYVSAVLMGGRGSVKGSVIAGASLVLFPEILHFGRYSTLVGAVALVLAVRFFPGGINEATEHQHHAVRGLVDRLRGRGGLDRGAA